MNQKVENLKGKLIVSCQALSNEPLHSSFIMGRMALAAKERGAFAIYDSEREKNNPFINRLKEADPELYEEMKKYGRLRLPGKAHRRTAGFRLPCTGQKQRLQANAVQCRG